MPKIVVNRQFYFTLSLKTWSHVLGQCSDANDVIIVSL